MLSRLLRAPFALKQQVSRDVANACLHQIFAWQNVALVKPSKDRFIMFEGVALIAVVGL